MRIASFDIGLKTCSMCVEEYKIDPSSYTIPPEKERYEKKTKAATQAMQTLINEIAQRGSIIFLEKQDLGDRQAYHAGFAFLNLYNWMERLHPYLQDCDLILIEQQMLTNNMAISLMNHLYAFLLIRYTHERKKENKPTIPIKLYPSKNKTRVLGAPLKQQEETLAGTTMTTVSKYQRKKWSTNQADALLQLRGDKTWHEYIFKTNKKKKDDLSDVIMQNLSYMVKMVLKEEIEEEEEDCKEEV
jgi:hypothetical protein